jgi:esterase/lipase superfamily enzyme
MELLVFGHAGDPVMVFPTSMGRFFEYEDRGMVGALAGKIEAGQITLICVDSIDRESWYNRSIHPHDRVTRHLAYESYLLDEVVPFIQNGLPRHDPRITVTGCSLGAFQAGLLAFRHPDAIHRLLGLSGKYDNSMFLWGYADLETYLTNPLAFLRTLEDGHLLEALRAMQIIIVAGSTDPHIHESRELSSVLWEKGIPNTLDVWDGWVHDWPYWEKMIDKFL